MHEATIACLYNAYLLTLVYRYAGAIVPLTSLLVHAYGSRLVIDLKPDQPLRPR